MNNLKTTDLGRMPIVLDDLRFINDSLKEVINGIVAHDTSSVVILSGCEIDYTSLSAGTLNMTAGAVYYNGEIYSVNAVTSMTYDLTVRWEIEETNDPAGLKTFASGTSHNTYKIRKAVVKQGGTVPSGALYFALTRSIFDIYRNGMGKYTELVKVDPFISVDSPYSKSANNPLRAWKNVNGSISFTGELITSGGNGSTIGLLDPEFRPTKTRNIVFDVFEPSGVYIETLGCSISASGSIGFLGTSPISAYPANSVLRFNEQYEV
jgi:hypothetical protein